MANSTRFHAHSSELPQNSSISRRKFLKNTSTSLAAAAASSAFPVFAAGESAEKADHNRPNILYLHTHDIGRYCQPYGYPVPTPNMQKLACDGVLFRQAFTPGPTCSPGRAALLTGRYPHSCGMLGLVGPNFNREGFRLNDYSRHIVHTLGDKAGYHSALIGIQHVANNPKKIGYDELVPLAPVPDGTRHRFAERTTRSAEKWLRNPPRKPFFLSVGYALTHRPFGDPGEQEDPRYCRPPAPICDTPETRRSMAAFKTRARILDSMYGRVLEALKAGGLEKNTLVLCTTEHGIAFPAMKCNLNDHGTGVMLIMRGPGGFTGGKVFDSMVSLIDVFPSLCDLLRIEKPRWLQGRSFMPMVRGETDRINNEIFGEVTYHGVYEPKRSIRTERWKYIRRWPGRTKPVSWNCDPSPAKELWEAHGWAEKPVPDEELYDLIFDPMERDNLMLHPTDQNRKAAERLRKRLYAWMEETDDPLLKGPVVDPPLEKKE